MNSEDRGTPRGEQTSELALMYGVWAVEGFRGLHTFTDRKL